MKRFERLAESIDISPFLDELWSFPGVWSERRAMNVACQRETISIPLREPIPIPGEDLRDCERDMATASARYFQKLMSFLQRVAEEQDATLHRVNIASLKPGGRVYEHRDDGKYYARRDRYHLVLQSKGSRMRSGGEECIWQAGELWRFDNKALHEAFNDSEDTERVHVIFDLKRRPRFIRILLTILN